MDRILVSGTGNRDMESFVRVYTHVGCLECSLEHGNSVVLCCDIAEGLGSAKWVLLLVFFPKNSQKFQAQFVDAYYFSTHGWTRVFSLVCFSVLFEEAPFAAATAAFRALRSKKLAMAHDWSLEMTPILYQCPM